MQGWTILRDRNWLGANLLEIKWNTTFRIMQVIQTIDCILCQSSVAFILFCTRSLPSLKIMPKRISKEPGDLGTVCNLRNFWVDLNNLLIRAYITTLCLAVCSYGSGPLQGWRALGVNLYLYFLIFFPLSPSTLLFCVYLLFSYEEIFAQSWIQL